MTCIIYIYIYISGHSSMYTLYADDIRYRIYLNITSVAILCQIYRSWQILDMFITFLIFWYSSIIKFLIFWYYHGKFLQISWYSSSKHTNRPSHGKPMRPMRRFRFLAFTVPLFSEIHGAPQAWPWTLGTRCSNGTLLRDGTRHIWYI